METKVLSLLTIVSVLLPFAAVVNAQQKELRKIELNVFRVDAATAVARVRGFFAKEGIGVNVTVTPNSTDQMRGMSKGVYNIASTGFDNVLAWSGREGAEIVAVAQSRDDSDLPVFARPEIRSWADLRGKKLAVDAVDTAFALVLRQILLAHNLDLNRSDYELVAVGATGQRFESMARGETFAGILSSPFDEKAASAGMVRLGDHREVLPNYPSTIYAVNRSWAEKQRDDLIRFLRGWLAGIRWVKDPANREQAIKLVADDLKLSSKAAAASVDEQSASGVLNVPGLKSVLDLRVQFGFRLPMANSLERYYDLSYFREAAGQ